MKKRNEMIDRIVDKEMRKHGELIMAMISLATGIDYVISKVMALEKLKKRDFQLFELYLKEVNEIMARNKKG